MSCDPAVLIQQINKLQYLEYTNIGWMKAELLNVEALGSQLPSTASVGLPALLDRFHCDLDDSAIHRELIAFFLKIGFVTRPLKVVVHGGGMRTFHGTNPSPAQRQWR
jgi:hypothetical protein